MSLLSCPVCGHSKFYAIEQITSRVECEISGDLSVEMSGMSEFTREDASSVTVAYMCAADCGYAVPAHQLSELKEAQA